MTTSRYLCPLDCGWHHDHNLTEPINPTATHFYDTQPPTEALDPAAWALSQMRTQFVEGLLREHCATHELLEWVQALQAAKQQLVDEKARQGAYEESVVGALNERNTRDCQRAERAEAELAENTSVMQALRRQRDTAEAQVAAVRAYADSLYSADRKIDACGVREKLYELLPMAPAEHAPDGFRWHVLSACPDEAACPIHGRNQEPAACPPACSEAHTYDGGCQLTPGLDGVISKSTNHEHPGWAWSCAEDDGCGWLSLGHGSVTEARRSYDRHRAKDCTRDMP